MARSCILVVNPGFLWRPSGAYPRTCLGIGLKTNRSKSNGTGTLTTSLPAQIKSMLWDCSLRPRHRYHMFNQLMRPFWMTDGHQALDHGHPLRRSPV